MSVVCMRGLCFLLLIFLAGCWGKGGESVASKEIRGSTSTTFSSTGESAVSKNATTVEWTETTYYFGTVQEGDVVEKTFDFVNTGGQPMLISNASSTCGCTVPEWPKEEILPRQKKSIKVRFDTKGKSGTQLKKVWVTANTDPAISTLVLQGEVLRSSQSAD